jgi:hypothetical protein
MYVVCVLLCSYCAGLFYLRVKPALLPTLYRPLVKDAFMTAEWFLKPKFTSFGNPALLASHNCGISMSSVLTKLHHLAIGILTTVRRIHKRMSLQQNGIQITRSDFQGPQIAKL